MVITHQRGPTIQKGPTNHQRGLTIHLTGLINHQKGLTIQLRDQADPLTDLTIHQRDPADPMTGPTIHLTGPTAEVVAILNREMLMEMRMRVRKNAARE